MFTGIITDIGTISQVTHKGDTRFDIMTQYAPDTIEIGASIACAGACLTVIEKGTRAEKNSGEAGHWFAVEASKETLDVTNAKNWRENTKLNLERALKMGDELGGHLVSGHVDGLASIIAIEAEGESKRFTFAAPENLMDFIAPKGSITLDGTSLTINAVADNNFGINIIAHTQNVTTWGQAQIGDEVNVEIDMLARYVARLRQVEQKDRSE